jgi:hypothetical protein
MAQDMIAVLEGLGLSAAFVSPSGSNGGNRSGGSDFFPHSPTLPSGQWGLAAAPMPSPNSEQPRSLEEQQADDDEETYASYLAGFAGGTGFNAENVRPSGSGGGNYSGGSAYFPSSPTLPSGQWGLAGEQEIGGYSIEVVNPSGSGGGNYSGGSAYFPRSPTLPSGAWGLAELGKSILHRALHSGASPEQAVMIARRAVAAAQARRAY